MFLIVAFILAAACGKKSTVSNSQIHPVDIPPGYDFPGDRNQIQNWANDWKTGVITKKAWDLWAGMTVDVGGYPVWETWCGQEEVFSNDCGKANRSRPSRPFKHAAQLTHMGKANPASFQLVSFNKFNPPMANFITAPHNGPGKGTFFYYKAQSLADLNQAMDKNQIPAVDRKIDPVPQNGIETKPVLFLVKGKGLSPIPLWTGIKDNNQTTCSSGPAINCHPDPTTWMVCALVDPSSTAPANTPLSMATKEQVAQMNQDLKKAYKCSVYLYAPISTIYAVQLNKEEAEDFNTIGGESGDSVPVKAEAGDYSAFVAMHVGTKEIENWTWQTFWWQPDIDSTCATCPKYTDFPGSKQGMTGNVKNEWRNYAMCTAYNQTKGQSSNEMVICFNPYLETSGGIPDGTQSNCMTCHGLATVGSQLSGGSPASLGYPNPKTGIGNSKTYYGKPIQFGYYPEGSQPDSMFDKYTRTDFSWAIQGDAK